MLAGELVIVKQGDGGIEIAFQMGCSIMLVVSAAAAVDVAAFEHMRQVSPWRRKISATSSFGRDMSEDLCRSRLADVQGVKGTFDLSDRIDCDPGIPSGGVDMPVSQQVLNDADVHSLLQQVRGEAVSQRVDGDHLIQAGSLGGQAAGTLQGAHCNGTGRVGAREQEVLRTGAPPIGAKNAEQLLG
jgi:hypothetical protein